MAIYILIYVCVADIMPCLLYGVAQNKIPYETICNIFATSGQI